MTGLYRYVYALLYYLSDCLLHSIVVYIDPLQLSVHLQFPILEREELGYIIPKGLSTY